MTTRRLNRAPSCLAVVLAALAAITALGVTQSALGNDGVSRGPRFDAASAESAGAALPSTHAKRPATEANRPRVLRATEANFAELVLDSDVPVLVDFYADWCGPCRAMAPVLEELARETPQARIVKVDVDAHPKLAARYGVKSLPGFVVFQGGQIVARHTGVAGKKRLQSLLDLYADAPAR